MSEHKTRVDRAGVGWATCWVARCSCGWQQRGSCSRRAMARDFADGHELSSRTPGGSA